MQKIAVAGATGRVGRHVVEVLTEAGHGVVAMSRATGVDVVTGKGLDEALAGVGTIIDVSTQPTPDEKAATDFFLAAARNLQAAGARAGVQRLVVVSIIGVERYAGGYNAAKAAHERAVLAGPIPTRILRAAQFHEFVEPVMQWGRQGDVVYMLDMRTQIVAARAVAEELAAIATAPSFDGPTITEIAGPREESMVELARHVAAKRGEAVQVLPAPADPSDADAAVLLSDAPLPGPGAKLAGPTFADWLEAAPVAS